MTIKIYFYVPQFFPCIVWFERIKFCSILFCFIPTKIPFTGQDKQGAVSKPNKKLKQVDLQSEILILAKDLP